jgi:hypothetical protein
LKDKGNLLEQESQIPHYSVMSIAITTLLVGLFLITGYYNFKHALFYSDVQANEVGEVSLDLSRGLFYLDTPERFGRLIKRQFFYPSGQLPFLLQMHNGGLGKTAINLPSPDRYSKIKVKDFFAFFESIFKFKVNDRMRNWDCDMDELSSLEKQYVILLIAKNIEADILVLENFLHLFECKENEKNSLDIFDQVLNLIRELSINKLCLIIREQSWWKPMADVHFVVQERLGKFQLVGGEGMAIIKPSTEFLKQQGYLPR